MAQIALSAGSSTSVSITAGNWLLISGSGTYRVGPLGTSQRPSVDQLIDETTVVGPFSDVCTVTIFATGGGAAYEMVAPTDAVGFNGKPAAVSGAGTQWAYRYSRLTKTAGKLAKIRAGVAGALLKVGIVGDSTTAGAGAGTGTANMVGARANGIAVRLASLITQMGVTARADSFIGDQYCFGAFGNGTSYPSYDPRVALGGGAATVGNANFRATGGLYFRLGVGHSMTFDPGIAWDTAVIYTADDAAGAATVSLGNAAAVGGASTITNVSTSVATLKTATATITKATTTAILTRTSGNPDFRGIWCYDSTVPAVHIFGLGAYGLKMSVEAAGSGTSCPYTTAVTADAWDLLIVDMSINDMATTPVETYIAALTSVVNAQIAAGGDVIVCTPNCINTAAYPLADSYLAAIRAYCQSAGVYLIDSWADQVSYSISNASSLMADSVHPTSAGYADKAWRFARAILGLA